jgi:SAM-dependent methyltransferase
MLVLANPDIYKEKEALYYKVRDKEGRIITDELLLQLPFIPADNPYKKEWDLRDANFERLAKYLQKKADTKQLNILDVGCGNGWMSNQLYKLGYNVTGIDLNMEELQQAERTFGTNPKLQWAYADVLTDTLPFPTYDIIIFGASCQYFDDIAKLTRHLNKMLSANGEIHLVDSVFYKQADAALASERSHTYYSNLGFPLMAQYYHHHTIEALKKTGYNKVYPTLFSKSTPLQWWKYVKQ